MLTSIRKARLNQRFRQDEITGPDAAKFGQMLTPRDLSKMAVGQGK